MEGLLMQIVRNMTTFLIIMNSHLLNIILVKCCIAELAMHVFNFLGKYVKF